MWIFALVGAALINAARGGRFAVVSALPGHTRLYASLAFALLALAWTRNPLAAITWGGCFLFWSWLPWGRWFDLNHSSTLPDRPPSWFECGVEAIAHDNDAAAFAIRNAVALLPAAILISPFILALVALQHASYAVGWALAPRRAIEAAEYLTGLAWGAALLLL